MIIPTRRIVRGAGLACAGAVLVSVAGCAAATPRPDPAEVVKPADRSCWPSERGFTSAQPYLAAPGIASGFSPAPVKAHAGLAEEGDDITGHELITDFPLPPNTSIADPAREAVVAVSFTVRTTDPRGWELGKSMGLLAFEDLGERGQLWKPICPAKPTEVGEALRASGREPLPAHIGPGQSVTGWVAFLVPRSTQALTLRLQHIRPDGGWSATSGPLMALPNPHPDPHVNTGANPGPDAGAGG